MNGRSSKAPRRGQGGFTLAELAVTVVVIGILGVIIGSYLDVLSTVNREGYVLEQNRTNRLIADAMLEWAEYHNQSGLPPVFTDTAAATRMAPLDPAAGGALGTLRQLIGQKGVAPAQINDDGGNLAHVRVYQMVDNLTAQVPFFGLSGGNVTLRYQSAAVYLTDCPRSEPDCNRMSGAPPGDGTPALTSANLTTWQTTGTDMQPARVNTLDLQRRLLSTSVFRVNAIRDALRLYYNARQIAGGPAAATVNFFPTATSGSLEGANPVSNDGCHDGWYPLGDPAADADPSNNAQTPSGVLPEIGLGMAEYGVTAWNGMVEYCRDYEPSATGPATANTPPHYAAIRLNPNVSQGLRPVTGSASLVFSL